MKKNVVYIISDIDKALAFEWITLYLNKDKYNLSFILLNNGNSVLEDFLRSKNVTVYRVGYKGKRSLLSALVRVFFLLRKLKAAVIHTHLIDASLVGLMAGKLLGVPKRIHTRHHSTYFHVYFPKSVVYDQWINYLSTDIIAITDVVKNILINKEGVDPKKITRVNHGFEFEERSQLSSERTTNLLRKYNIKETDRPVVGVISRFIELKGIQYIIPAFQKLLTTHPNALLLLANASGTYAAVLEKQLSELPSHSYRLIKFEPDVFALYTLMDVYVHVPISEDIEAFGQTYVEALSMGLPCVFTKSGIACEFIKDQENALVVPYKDSEAIGKALSTLLGDKALAQRLGETGKAYVWKAFNIQRMIQALEDVYDARSATSFKRWASLHRDCVSHNYTTMSEVKSITSLVYHVTYFLKLESLFVFLGKAHPFFHKFIPQPSFYKADDIRTVRRDGALFRLNLSDYMQWHIYANLSDNSWKKAIDYLQDDATILDIGANSGAFCLKLAKYIEKKGFKRCQVFAFEPNPFVLEYLETNLMLNPGLEQIVKICPFGLGAKDEALPFEFNKDNSGGGKFAIQSSGKTEQVIRIRRLDNFIKEQFVKSISFIKLDVEGFEPFVLEGAMETIRTFKPDMFVEITDKWFREKGSSAEQVLGLLRKEGYDIYREDEHDQFIKLPQGAEMKIISSTEQFNIVAIRQA